MAAIRSTDTSAERRVRSALHRLGVRFRLNQVVHVDGRRLRPDLVFKRAGVAVFIDGCFWHGCPEHCRRPSSNTQYWNPKIERNQARDARTDAALGEAGWTVIRVWEHEPAGEVAGLIKQRLDERQGQARPRT